jgi:hypothetical protein
LSDYKAVMSSAPGGGGIDGSVVSTDPFEIGFALSITGATSL